VALGAETADVLRMMVNGSMVWVLVGLARRGCRLNWITRLLTGMLYGVEPLDPAVLAEYRCWAP